MVKIDKGMAKSNLLQAKLKVSRSKVDGSQAGPALDPNAFPGDHFEAASKGRLSDVLRASLPSSALDANQARGLKEAGELAKVKLEVSTFDAMRPGLDQLTGKGSSRFGNPADRPASGAGGLETHPDAARFPELPGNQGKSQGADRMGAMLRPSGDLRAAASGAAFNKDKTIETLDEYGSQRVTEEYPDGTVTRDTTIRGGDRGTRLGPNTVRLPSADGTEPRERIFEVFHTDGSHSIEHYRWNQSGGRWDLDARAHLPPIRQEDLNRTQDPDADSGGGPNPVTGQSRGSGPVDPNRVNPGPEGAIRDFDATRLRPKDLATDPWEAQGVREMSAEQAARLFGALELGTHVNPPAPDEPGGE